MAEQFMRLPEREQAEILIAIAHQLKKEPVVLEKDIWVCWTLRALFTMPGRLPMAFKGGTALSKVYNVIERFSEDLDITLDYRGFIDEIKGEHSRSAVKKISEQLKVFVANHSRNVVKPYFENLLVEQFPGRKYSVDISEDGEKLRIYYPSVLEEQFGRYLAANILIEFGGRNITEPNEQHIVRPYVAELLMELEFPEATVTVLAIARSFWEKATLIHVECNRTEFKVSGERLSRHWYDMSCLHRSGKALNAIADRALLEDVIKYKKLFYNASYANYNDCLASSLKLIPDSAFIAALEKDFQQMVEAGMFYGTPSFDQIISDNRELETLINTTPDGRHCREASDT
ncbi:nucleotidyl transferase AbiEii/AbiGii toxin family protein [bacterium]|nr:nucleotidyl transferase AbiEii/AbiGii toxin family protein [bacterium]MBP9809478.1 nucleotidyl transferase AbiEii/AbiGii toxin family protein [bacterium]